MGKKKLGRPRTDTYLEKILTSFYGVRKGRTVSFLDPKRKIKYIFGNKKDLIIRLKQIQKRKPKAKLRGSVSGGWDITYKPKRKKI